MTMGRISQQTDNEGHTALDDPPPQYEAVSQNPWDAGGTRVLHDGRVSVNASSRLCKTLSRLFPPSSVQLESPTPSWEESPPPPFRLNIVIQIVGSRGDVQPFVALGAELQKCGHRVRIATHDVFAQFIRQSGLEFYPIGGDPAELMAYMVKNPALIPSMSSLLAGDIKKKRALIAEILHGCWRSCIDVDPVTQIPFVAEAIIANPPSFAHVHCAQALGIPLHLMFTMPWSATRAFAHPLANLQNVPQDRDWINRVSYDVVDWLSWQGLGDVINDWRQNDLELDSIPMAEGPFIIKKLQIPYTYCWSPALIPKPHDWPSNFDVCGFFFRDIPDYKPDPELESFLAIGLPPIYIGFGSIVIDNPEALTAVLLEAIRQTGVRAIISRGWSNLHGPDLPNVLYLGDCPHEWLFQHVSAVIHHGGAGTTACGLRYGKPTIIIPFFGDQPFWGEMVAAAGAGPRPIPHGALDTQRLVEAIQYCLGPEALKAAHEISARIQGESGVKAAVASFHRHLPQDLMTCDILPMLPAAWRYRKGGKQYRLSKVAAEVLVDHLAVDAKKLKPYQPKPIFIVNKRWDPVTGISSAGVGLTVDMLKASSDIICKPYQAYKQDRVNRSPSQSAQSQTVQPQTRSLLLPSPQGQANPAVRKAQSMIDLRHPTEHGPDELNVKVKGRAKAMALASVQASGKLVTKYLAGTLVDVPLAAAEGFRVLPGLYGDKVHEYDQVTDWKTGLKTGAKCFAIGMAESMGDFFYQPYKGVRDGGAIGLANGMFRGTFGVVAKMSHASLGLVAYPGQGVKQSIRSAFRDRTRKSIIAALHANGRDMLRRERASGMQDDVVLKAFSSRAPSNNSDDEY